MMIGEAPGEDEDKQGRPFVGRSGKLIESLLKQAGMSRDTIWITNVNKCRPVKIEGKVYKNRAPTVKEQQACEIWRRNEIDLLKPKIILALGATAAKALGADKTFQITKDRGQWMPGPQGTEMLVTFHPSYILRQFEPALTEVKATVLEDLKRVKARLDALQAGTAEPQPWQRSKDDNGEGQQLSLF
jgi:DNA polymerase